jgi:ankyrin repeat protein
MNTQFYLHLSKKTIPEGQSWFIDKLRTLIKVKSLKEEFDEGLCYGISLMWIQALLVGSKGMDTFHRRLAIIAKFKNAEEMNDAIERINLKKINKEKISDNDEITLSIREFLNGLLFHACLGEFAELFPGRRIPNQQGKISLEYTSPVELKQGIHQARLTRGATSEDVTSASLVGLYTKQELITYFESLQKILQTEPPVNYSFGIELGTPKHSISVGYDYTTKRWLFTDANDLPPKPVTSFDALANHILRAETFKPYKGMVSFGSSFYVAGEHKDDFDAKMQKWKASEDWKKIHEVTEEKVKYFNKKEKFSWLSVAIFYHDENLAMQLIRQAVRSQCLQPLIDQGLLHDAAKAGLSRVVRFLLPRVKRSTPNKDGETPLHIAARSRQKAIVKILLEEDPDASENLVGAKTPAGETPLHAAAEKGEVEIAQLLLTHGAVFNTPDASGGTPFHAAAKSGNVAMLQLLYEKDPNQVKAIIASGDTPLHIAAEEGKLDAVRFLLEIGAEPNAINTFKETALHAAAAAGHLEVVKCLKDHGADRNIKNFNKERPIYFAAENGHLAVLEYLFKKEHLNLSNDDGNSLLHIAAKKGHHKIVKFLKEEGAKSSKRNHKDELPLQLAVKKGRLKVVKLLLKYGDDKDMLNKRGESLAYLAAKNGHLNTLKLLKKRGVSLDKANHQGETPLQVATRKGRTDIVAFFTAPPPEKTDTMKQVQQHIFTLDEDLGADDLAKVDIAELQQPIEPQAEPARAPEAPPLVPQEITPPLSTETTLKLDKLSKDLKSSLTYQYEKALGSIYGFFTNYHHSREPKLQALLLIAKLNQDNNKAELKTFIQQMLTKNGSYQGLNEAEVMYTTWPLKSRTAILIHDIANELGITSEHQAHPTI